MQRGYLLPPGCKDLIDVLNLQGTKGAMDLPICLIDLPKFAPQLLKLTPEQLDHLLGILKKVGLEFFKCDPLSPHSPSASPLPPVTSQVVIPAETSAAQVASLLGQKVSRIIADVLELGFYVTAKDALSFEIISSVARKHGFLAIRAAT